MSKIGYAVDLGTTTIDTCLFDTETKQIIAKASCKNRQSLYGSDVLNRILNVTRKPSLEKTLKALAMDDIEKMLKAMIAKTKFSLKDMVGICICGNTTMISILLEYNIESLGRYPFTSKLSGNVETDSKSLFDLPDLSCKVLLSGCASAFIGGDILSGVVYLSGKYSFGKDSTDMLIDMGTNGEMFLVHDNSYYTASAACGPAFEGCLRKQNVYGSNAIDAIAMGVKTRRINNDGVIAEPYFESGIDIMNVHIDMDILRQFILAKAAIRAGIETLSHASDVSLDKIDNVYIAGGFGFYLNLDNAVRLGLLPEEFKGKINIVGNTSLLGAIDMLANNIAYEKSDKLTRTDITLVSLAESELYKERLIEHMHL